MNPNPDAKPVRISDPQAHNESVRPRGFRARLSRNQKARLPMTQARCGKEQDIEKSQSILEPRVFDHTGSPGFLLLAKLTSWFLAGAHG